MYWLICFEWVKERLDRLVWLETFLNMKSRWFESSFKFCTAYWSLFNFFFFFAFEYRFLQNPRKYHKSFLTYFLSIISQFFHHEYFIRIKGKITRKVEEKIRILVHHFSTFWHVHKLRNAPGGPAICYEPLYGHRDLYVFLIQRGRGV